MKTIKFIVQGKVQGVFFRHHTKKTADSLGLKGFVRNLENGDVGVIATGEEEEIRRLEDFLRVGPQNSKVKDVKKKEIEKKEFDNFSIRY